MSITFFVSGDKYRDVLFYLLDNVSVRLYISVYEFSYKKGVQELYGRLANASRNVKDCKIVFNFESFNKIKKKIEESLPFLREFAGQVYLLKQVTLHAKLVIADGVLLCGSTNWSVKALQENLEANIVTTDFNAVWGAVKWFNDEVLKLAMRLK